MYNYITHTRARVGLQITIWYEILDPARHTSTKANVYCVMEDVVSFVSGEAVGGRGQGGKPAATRLLYSQFTQLDAADDNGSVALGAVDKAHGSFTRRSTLIFAAGGAHPMR